MASIPAEITTETKRWAPRMLAGALAGMIAAIPMALVMAGLDRLLPASKGSWLTRWLPLPPKQITNRLSRRFGIPGITQQGREWNWPTWLAHLGYGAATASLYPVITRPLHIPKVLRGMLFALGIWAASYMGWLPAVNIIKPATKQPARRNIVLIGSHLVWGSLIGLLASFFVQRVDRFQRRNSPNRVIPQQSSRKENKGE